MKTIKITKKQAEGLHLSSTKPSRAVKVGPNIIAQPCIGRRQQLNTLGGLRLIGRKDK